MILGWSLRTRPKCRDLGEISAFGTGSRLEITENDRPKCRDRIAISRFGPGPGAPAKDELNEHNIHA